MHSLRAAIITRWAIGILLFPAFCLAQYDRPGSTDAQFLKIGVSPRGTALSDAYIAVVGGAEATYYNSSALPWMKGTDVALNHNSWFAGISHDFFAVAHNFGDLGAVGVSVTSLRTDLMEVRTPLQPEGTGETFFAANYKFALSYSHFLTDQVSLGASVGFIRMSLFQDFNANAFSVDIATTYVSSFHGFRFAMEIMNFGSNIQYVNESYPLPTNFTFGAAINAVDEDIYKLLVSLAAVKPNEGAPQAQVGLEWNYDNFLFVRGGYRIANPIATFSAGGGVHIAISDFTARVDYSYSGYVLLGAAHRIGIGLEF
jgi:hypothetical protein